MTERKCYKCSDDMVVNSKLGLMECVSGKHIEPINLIRAQWWNQCTKCGQKGVNDAENEPRLQNKKALPRIEYIEQEAKPITCKACANVFTKN